MAFDKSILFLSGFGQPVNKAVSGTAINGNFQNVTDSNNPAVAPWTSATPLSGELLQASLDALLQNDINLVSAYPDAYLKTAYTGGVTKNIQQFSYAPAGTGQTVESGDAGWTNSVMVSSYVGTVGGPASAIMLGALVPAHPFQQGKGWNYGLFGVQKGAPTWFPISEQFLKDQSYLEYAVGGSLTKSGTYYVAGDVYFRGQTNNSGKLTISVPALTVGTSNALNTVSLVISAEGATSPKTFATLGLVSTGTNQYVIPNNTITVSGMNFSAGKLGVGGDSKITSMAFKDSNNKYFIVREN